MFDKTNELKFHILSRNFSAAGFMSPEDIVEVEATQSHLSHIIWYIPKIFIMYHQCYQAISPSCHFDPPHTRELLHTYTTVELSQVFGLACMQEALGFSGPKLSLTLGCDTSYSNLTILRCFAVPFTALSIDFDTDDVVFQLNGAHAKRALSFIASTGFSLEEKIVILLWFLWFVTYFAFIFWQSIYSPHIWRSPLLDESETSSPGRCRSVTNTHSAINSHKYLCADTYSFINGFRTNTCRSGTNTCPAMNSHTYSRTDTYSSTDSERQQRAPMRNAHVLPKFLGIIP